VAVVRFPLRAQILLVLLVVAVVAAVVSPLWWVRLAAGAGAALAGGLLLGWHIVRPLRRLAQASDAIGETCSEVEVAVRSPDEIGRLAASFNRMCANLQRHMREKELANRGLQDVNERYIELLGFAWHELLQPVGAIKGYLTLMRDAPNGTLAPESQKQAIAAMLRNVDALVGMSHTYLALAKVEFGGLQLQRQRVRMYAETVAPVLEDVWPRAAARQMRLVVEEEKAFRAVELDGDAALLRAVWYNLLTNAVKYGREGGEIRLGWSDDVDGHRFHVRNEGPGVSAERLDELFGKFVRLEATARGRKGTGLGLFLAREIVERHGGTIGAESEEGAWADFFFRLPK
jgi:signal transduction histidine kinase